MINKKTEAGELIASFIENSLGSTLPKEYEVVTRIVEFIPIIQHQLYMNSQKFTSTSILLIQKLAYKRLARSKGLTISVIRTPKFSSITTTSPFAVSCPLT